MNRKSLPENDIDFEVESDHELESAANPFRDHRHAANKSLAVENENVLELPPCQDKKTKHFFNEKSEELAFTKIFFKGELEYTFPCEIYLTSTKYFNQRFLNCSQTSSSNSGYIFFAQSVLQQKNFSDQINMAMIKVTSRLTAGMFPNYEESARHCV